MSQSLTQTEARDAIFALVKAAWDPTGLAIYWENTEFEPPSANYAHVFLNHVGGGQRTLGSPAKFERVALLTVQIWTKAGHGMGDSDTLSQTMLNALEGKKTTTGAVWFRNVRSSEGGVDGDRYLTNVFAEAIYEELK